MPISSYQYGLIISAVQAKNYVKNSFIIWQADNCPRRPLKFHGNIHRMFTCGSNYYTIIGKILDELNGTESCSRKKR